MWGAPGIAPLLLGLSLLDYLLSRYLVPEASIKKSLRQLILTLGILVNLSLLFYFKYWNFFLTELNTAFASFGFNELYWKEVLLPIGISFFTFQKISYLVDIYRGTAERAKSFVNYALYVALFPQLIAGPIVRYHEIAAQFQKREHSWDNVTAGVTRFSIGLAKKVLIADYVGQIADSVFTLDPSGLTTPYAWLGILAYAFQIYFDFSGYSDMAIGIGRMFGFTFPENFNQPYLSRSFQEFWTRWHMTLSNWMKEYLYIPLGGNRSSHFRTALNLWIVFLLSGLWHGASWSFVMWGALHGFFLSLEKLFGVSKENTKSHLLILIVFPLVLLTWVPFRVENISDAFTFYSYLFALQGVTQSQPIVLGDLVQVRDIAMLTVACLFAFIPFQKSWSLKSLSLSPAISAASYCVLLLSLFSLAGMDYTPFLYFRF